MSEKPEITIILSVHNSELYLAETLDSIFEQTFTNFELIIIDDCSTDNTREIIKEYTNNNKKCQVYHNSSNQGLTKNLNFGIRYARGRYIARMDADDICAKDRLYIQYSFLENNSDISVVGSWVQFIDKFGTITGFFQPPTTDSLIKWELLFQNPLVHPSIMFRKEIIERFGNYDEKCYCSQDYELWIRLYFQLKYAIIPKYLLQLRKHENNLSSTHSHFQTEVWNRCSNAVIARLISEKTISKPVIEIITGQTDPKSFIELNKAVKTLIRIYHSFIRVFPLKQDEKKYIKNSLFSKIQLIISRYSNHSKLKFQLFQGILLVIWFTSFPIYLEYTLQRINKDFISYKNGSRN